MPPNVFLVGAQCTGKTTLLEALEIYFSSNSKCLLQNQAFSPPAIIREVVRDVMKERNLSSSDVGTCRWQSLQRHTLQAQHNAEERIQHQWFISDRSSIDPILYSRLHGGTTPDLSETEAWRPSRERMRSSLVILCEAGNSAWLNTDSARLAYKSVEDWTALNLDYASILQEQEVAFVTLPKELVNIKERMEFVIQHLAMMMANR